MDVNVIHGIILLIRAITVRREFFNEKYIISNSFPLKEPKNNKFIIYQYMPIKMFIEIDNSICASMNPFSAALRSHFSPTLYFDSS